MWGGPRYVQVTLCSWQASGEAAFQVRGCGLAVYSKTEPRVVGLP